MGKRLIAVLLLTLGMTAGAASSRLEDLRMDKRFGVGIEAGGPLALLGLSVDVNVTENFSISGGLGTGLDYNSLAFKARYFLLGKHVSPYIGAGVARWWSNGTRVRDFSPGILRNDFIKPTDDLSDGFSVWMVYPVAGVQFFHVSGFEFSAEAQYLFKLFDFASGAYAGLGVHWYF
jgi:hypothetical protein